MFSNTRVLSYVDIYIKPLLFVLILIALYCVTAALFPFSGDADIVNGIIILVFFIAIFILSTFLFFCLGAGSVSRKRFSFDLGNESIFPFFVSLTGIVFLIIDKVYFRGIDFINMTPAEVRNQISSENASGISSVFSLFGNVFQSVIIISAFNSIFRDYGLRFFFRQVLFIFVVFMSSYILGGRTPLLTYLVIVFAIYITSGRAVSAWNSLKFIVPAVIFALIFALSIFVLRAKAIGINSSEYLYSMLIHLGAANVNDAHNGDGFFVDIKNYCYVIIAYLVHPFWVSSQIVLAPSGEGNISFYTLLFLFSKILPIDLEAAKHQYYELFASLPGGLYYDFGLFGVFFYAFFLALIGFLGVITLIVSRGLSRVGHVLVIFCLSTLLLSPLLHSLNFVFFIFYMAVLAIYSIYKDISRAYSSVYTTKKDRV